MRHAVLVIDMSNGIDSHEPSTEQRQRVAKAVACGVGDVDIAFLIGVDLATLKKHYYKELTHGLAYYVAEVGAANIDAALRGDVRAQQFFLGARARWAPPSKAEIGMRDSDPIEIEARRALMDRILDMVKPKEEAEASHKS